MGLGMAAVDGRTKSLAVVNGVERRRQRPSAPEDVRKENAPRDENAFRAIASGGAAGRRLVIVIGFRGKKSGFYRAKKGHVLPPIRKTRESSTASSSAHAV